MILTTVLSFTFIQELQLYNDTLVLLWREHPLKTVTGKSTSSKNEDSFPLLRDSSTMFFEWIPLLEQFSFKGAKVFVFAWILA